MGTEANDTQSVTDIVHRSTEAAQNHDRVSVAHLTGALGHGAIAPMLLVPALAVVTPLSGIPGFSAVCGIAIALVSVQMLWRADTVWLPNWLLRRRLPGARMEQASIWLERAGHWLDRITRPRLAFLVSFPGVLLPELTCLLAGLLMPFLEVVPFSSSMVGASVSLLAVGLVARDGLFVLAGLFVFGGLAGLIATLLA